MVASLLLHMCVSKHKVAVCKGVNAMANVRVAHAIFIVLHQKTHDTAGWLTHV